MNYNLYYVKQSFKKNIKPIINLIEIKKALPLFDNALIVKQIVFYLIVIGIFQLSQLITIPFPEIAQVNFSTDELAICCFTATLS